MATAIPSNTARFSVWELAAVTGGELTQLPDDRATAVGIATDSRAVVPGQGFVAISGERLDGHDFVDAAVASGASVVVVEHGRIVASKGVAVVEVDSGLAAFGRLACAHVRRWRRNRPGARIAAITGSAGKTTTKELLSAILSAVGPCHATTGNLNNRVGLPAVALGLLDQASAVFELGMSMPGEIAELAGIVLPDVAVLLNVGVAHAEGFGGSRAGIAREKGAIFEALSERGVAVVNADDPAAEAQLTRTSARHVRFGTTERADVRLVGRKATGAGSRVTLVRAGETFDVALPIPGEAAALDLAAAVAAADATCGSPIPASVIFAAVGGWTPPAGRSVVFELESDVWVLDDSYNANPASMRAAFETLAELRSAGRRRAICVLGEMRELGPLSHGEHDAIGEELVRHRFDLVIGCGGAVDVALRRAEQGGLAVRRAEHAEQAGELVASLVGPGDVVLFKGSRGAAVERGLAILEARYRRVASLCAPTSRGAT